MPRLLAIAAVFGQPLADDVAAMLWTDQAPPGVGVHPLRGAARLARVPEQPGPPSFLETVPPHRQLIQDAERAGLES